MRVLFDTNVLLDALLHRDTAHLYSSALLVMVANQYIDAYVAPHSLSNIYYILRKDKNEEERKQMISKILLYTKVVPIDNEIANNALNIPNISDYEDALQYACADAVHADFICTNDSVFKDKEIKALTAAELFQLLELP